MDEYDSARQIADERTTQDRVESPDILAATPAPKPAAELSASAEAVTAYDHLWFRRRPLS